MRDPERQARLGSTFNVTFPDFPGFQLLPRRVRIIQEIGKHDVVELYYPTFTRFFTKGVATGLPVRLTWKNDKASGEFIGYTTGVKYPTVQAVERGTTIRCVGASFPLKEKAHEIWVNRTASEIATDIANKFKLKPVVTQHPLRFKQQILGELSYWEKLNELADRIGYGIQVVGSELHFHPIDKMIDQFMTVIPVMAFLDPNTNPSASYEGGTLDMFEPMITDYNESSAYTRSTKVVSGVDVRTGKIYKATNSPNTIGKKVRKTTKDPLFTKVETNVVANTQSNAILLSEAKSQLSRLAIPARGAGQGDPRIAPWRTLEVRNTGDVSDGFWIVTSVEHLMFRDGRYQVEFKCATDGIGQNKPSATRPSASGTSPMVNLSNEVTKPKPLVKKSYKLSSPAAMVKQTQIGFKVTPRRWVDR